MLYSSSILYNLAINPVMVYTGFYIGSDHIISAAPNHIWMGVAVASGVALMGMVMMGCTMNATHRHTFYKHKSMAHLIDETWDTREKVRIKTTIHEGSDPSRARLLSVHPSYWVSVDKLRPWLNNWDTWEAEKPEWFTMKSLGFQRQVMRYAPAEALPRTVLLKILVEAKDNGSTRRVTPETTTEQLVSKVKKYRGRKWQRRRGADSGSAKVGPK